MISLARQSPFALNILSIAAAAAAAAAKLLQSCPTWCDPIDDSPPGSPFPGILQARTLEWVAISFSNAWKWKVKGKSLSCIQLLATPWAVSHQAPLSMGLSRQEYWIGVPLPSPKDVLQLLLIIAFKACSLLLLGTLLDSLRSVWGGKEKGYIWLIPTVRVLLKRLHFY